MLRFEKLWLGAAGALVLLQLSITVSLPRGYSLTVLSDVIDALVLGMLLVALARNAIHNRGRLRTFWVLQTVCWAFWLIDQGWWILYDVILGKPIPEMFGGDAVLFLTGLPMLAGLLLRPDVQPSQQSARLGIIDFLHLMLWWIYLYVFSVLCWKYVVANPIRYSQNYDYLYCLQIILILFVLGVLFKRSGGTWRRFYAYFFSAFLFNSISIVADNYAIEKNVYYNGGWYDIPYVASSAFFILVTFKGGGLRSTIKTPSDATQGIWMSRLAVVALLSLPIVIVTVLIENELPTEVSHFRVMTTAVTMLILSALVVVKQHRLHEELRRTNKRLELASTTDPLTMIRNRRFFSTTIEGDVAQTLRLRQDENDTPARALIFYLIDMDNFKEVNDRFGHDAGDRVLVETARRIQSAIRDSDYVVRWGGEEFLVVSQHADRTKGDTLALRIMQEIRGLPYDVDSFQQIYRTCSIGWAAFPWQGEGVDSIGYEEVLNMADRALGSAKRAGKNQVIGIAPQSIAEHRPTA